MKNNGQELWLIASKLKLIMVHYISPGSNVVTHS